MKHLLEHLEEELHEKLESLYNGGKTDSGKLEYIYRDLLNKVEQALEELEDSTKSEPNGNPMNNMFNYEETSDDSNNLSKRFKDLAAYEQASDGAKEIRDSTEKGNLADEMKSRAGLQDAVSDSDTINRLENERKKEDFIESLKDIGVDFDSMKHVANVENLSDDELTQIALDDAIEDVNKIDDVDPDVFRHIAQIAEHKKHAEDVNESTSENLVDWATGNKDLEIAADQEEVVQEIRSILQDAQKSSDGTSELLETFNDRIEELSVDSNVRPSVYPEVKESSNQEE